MAPSKKTAKAVRGRPPREFPQGIAEALARPKEAMPAFIPADTSPKLVVWDTNRQEHVAFNFEPQYARELLRGLVQEDAPKVEHAVQMPRPISDPIVGTVRSSPLSAMDNYLNDLHALTQVRKSHLARLYCLLTNAWDADMPDLPDVPIPNSGNKMGSLMGLIEYNRNLEKETEDAISRLETTL